MTTDANPLDRRTLDVFLGRLTGSESTARLDAAGRTGRTLATATHRPASSTIVQPAPGLRSDRDAVGCVQSPAVHPDHGESLLRDLTVLVVEMADELDRFPPGTFATTGPALRAHYRELARRDAAGALADARSRYEAQCVRCEVPPLPLPEVTL